MKQKNILLISYYWPPSGGAGVQRWLKMSKYLAEDGFKFHVYTPENPETPAQDEALLKEIHPSVKTISSKIFEPYQFMGLLSGKNKNHSNYLSSGSKKSLLSRMMTWVRGNIFIPDPRMFWIKPSVKFLSRYIQDEKIDTIISTGPPHSMHVIALRLKEKFPELKWLADFRDPWTFIDFFDQLEMNASSRKKHFALEKAVFNKADHAITVSPIWAKTYEDLYERKVEVVYNGYDHQDFQHKEKTDLNPYTLRYFGFMNADRNPDIFWQAIQLIKKEKTDLGKQLKVEIYGKVNTLITEKIKHFGLEDTVHLMEYIPHKEVTKLMMQSGMLLLILNNTPNENGIIPGKMYEYMGSGRPVLCIGNPSGDGSNILEECDCGKSFHFTDTPENVKAFIVENIDKESFFGSKEKVEKYTRKNQAEAYKKLLL